MLPTSRRSRSLLVLLAALLLTAVAARHAALPTSAAPPAVVPRAVVPQYVLAYELAGDFGFPRSTLSDLAGGRVYTAPLHAPRLNVIDTRFDPAVQVITLDQPVNLLGLNPAGTRLYMSEYDGDSQNILVFDTATLTTIDTITYDCPAQATTCQADSFAVGPAGRLYLFFSNQHTLLILDGQTGQQLHAMALPDALPGLIHGAALYTTTLSSDYTAVTLRRYDLSDVVPVLATEEPLPEEYRFSGRPQLAAAPNGSFLIAHWNTATGPGAQRLVRLDPLSLKVTLAYPVAPQEMIMDVFVAAQSDEVVVIGLPIFPMIHAYNAADGRLLRTGFHFDNYHDNLGFVPLAGNYLGNISEQRLVVLRPADHVATLPVVLANYCGGLITDDFSDPTSGWPVADRGTVAYSYAHNQYHGHHYAILHRVPDTWSGVSRGDTWQSWHSLSVQTTISKGIGTTGLIFGLNDDWSHFYSFEIIPELRRWVLYFYMDGWHIWATEEYEGSMPTGSFSLLGLKPTPDGQLDLQINYNTVFTFPEVPGGRVGLGAGSFYEGVGHTYDNFTIEPGPNCRPNNQSARPAIEQSPVLTQPPLPGQALLSPVLRVDNEITCRTAAD